MEEDKNIQVAKAFANKVHIYGGKAYFVGGYVRDMILGIPNKDIDIEIHGLPLEKVEEIINEIGKVKTFGKSFGVLTIKGYDIDISLPRKEKLIGRGHKDFDISIDPYIGIEKATMRRDFTINALLYDIVEGKVIDLYNGQADLSNKIIRHVNDTSFIEDPLRVLRGAQFASRFEFKMADETKKLCSTIDLSFLSKERIEGELNKALLKSQKPSLFFELLREINQLDVWFPEIKALIGINQNPKYHSEGDVWNHTMMVIDSATKYRDCTDNPYYYMLTCLVHDLGKIIATTEDSGIIHAHGHEILGCDLIKSFIRRITTEKELLKYVTNLVKLHMKPMELARVNASIKSTNKMFDECISPNDLIYLSLADNDGKIKLDENNQIIQTNDKEFLQERLRIFNNMMDQPYVNGTDLLEAGLKPDKYFSMLLKYAHKHRIAGVNKEASLRQTLAYYEIIKKEV